MMRKNFGLEKQIDLKKKMFTLKNSLILKRYFHLEKKLKYSFKIKIFFKTKFFYSKIKVFSRYIRGPRAGPRMNSFGIWITFNLLTLNLKCLETKITIFYSTYSVKIRASA